MHIDRYENVAVREREREREREAGEGGRENVY